ncbi:TIGR01777 family oxidoreductase [Rubripirellula amarantea]|nr:TIGR01777 family oxidoreductase [Rubripirellula amarantea]
MSSIQQYIAETKLSASPEQAFAYHERPGALQRLVPPWESVKIEHSDQSLHVGSQVVLKTKVAGVSLRWVAEHVQYDPPRLFADTQLSGPFKRWDHRHEFHEVADEAQSCRLRDEITYELPMGALGNLFGSGKARHTIEAMFAYRHRITKDDLAMASQTPMDPMRIAISGSSGLVGSNLSSMLTLLGHEVVNLVRSPDPRPDHLAVWSDSNELQQLSQCDAVVHLAGKSIASGRWSDEVKREIRDSRVIKTRQLCEGLASLDKKPKVLVCASATGIYGDRGDETLLESSSTGDDFLADVAAEWEAACQPAIDAGIRVVNTRFGIILSPQGGALQKTLLPAKFCGGALGNGQQWWSWIALDDVLGGIHHVLANDHVNGPVNFVSPNPIRNRDFAQTLGKVLNRPALIPAPAFGLRLALGEMADALLLASTRVIPEVLTETGYQFRFTDLADYLKYGLGRVRLPSLERNK